MTAGLLDLACVGVMSKHFIENPKFSFFKKVYKSYTPFHKYYMNLTDNKHKLRYDSPSSYNISVNKSLGHLLCNVIMNIDISNGNPDMSQFIRGFAVGIIDNIEISIGGQIIEILDPHIINFYNELWLNEAQRQYNDYLVGNKIQKGQKHFTVRLPFFFTRSYCKSLPLCALDLHEVKLKFQFKSINDIIKKTSVINHQDNVATNNLTETNITESNGSNEYTNNFNMNIEFVGEFIMLSDEEKLLFRSNELEYIYEIIEKLYVDGDKNKTISNSDIIVDINSNYIVSEYYTLFQYLDSNNKPYNNEILEYCGLNNDTNFGILYYDKIRCYHPGMNFYLTFQKIGAHTNIPRTKSYIPILNNDIITKIYNNSTDDVNLELLKNKIKNSIQHFEIDEKQYIYSYNFSLNPEDAEQPSGGVNASLNDHIKFKYENIDKSIIDKYKNEGYTLKNMVYSKHFNVLRIGKGLCHQLYSH
jgi:hypothetical protein